MVNIVNFMLYVFYHNKNSLILIQMGAPCIYEIWYTIKYT